MTHTPEVTISAHWGSQTFRYNSAKVHLFEVHNAEGKGFSTFFPGKKPGSSGLITQDGRYRTPAAANGSIDNGMWYGLNYTFREGTILLVQMSVTSHGSPYANGALFLALRKNAPTVSVKALLPSSHEATLTNVSAFFGNADILTAKDLEEYGVRVPLNYQRRWMSEEEIEELFEVDVISAGSPPPEKVIVRKPDGSTGVALLSKAPGRRLRIRRK